MSWKSFACLTAIAAITVPAVAQPTIEIVNNGDMTATLQVTPGANTAFGTSILVDFVDGLMLDGAPTLSGAIMDLDMNGVDLNPFENSDGSFGPQMGLEVDTGMIFAALGLDEQGTTAFDLFSFGFTGTGTINATGLIGQDIGAGSVNHSVSASLVIDGGVDPILGDFDGDGDVDLDDFGVFVGEFNQGSVPPAAGLADFDADGDIDLDDFGVFVGSFNASQAGGGTLVAVPEPNSIAIAALGMIAAAGFRRR